VTALVTVCEFSQVTPGVTAPAGLPPNGVSALAALAANRNADATSAIKARRLRPLAGAGTDTRPESYLLGKH
jgi:hypothetical protein